MFRERAEIPIEGVGVVQVVTEVSTADLRYGFTDVVLARYQDGELTSPVPLAGSVCESTVAGCMHENWCDVERLIRCIRGDTKTLYVLDIDWEIDECHPDPGLTHTSHPGDRRTREGQAGPVDSVLLGQGRP
ncbi:hypothetical protein [Mycolicibacterium peregrinum]|uniref:hypothetical protein n=1 Tax=Mycolicibacterium peregrinum TaxID=43304 RepID=UPI000A8BF27D|nr:hypothetical protein [Mycolicibacterium peregrinum]